MYSETCVNFGYWLCYSRFQMCIIMFMMTMMVQGRLGESKIFAFSGIYIEPDDPTVREADDYYYGLINNKSIFNICGRGTEMISVYSWYFLSGVN